MHKKTIFFGAEKSCSKLSKWQCWQLIVVSKMKTHHNSSQSSEFKGSRKEQLGAWSFGKMLLGSLHFRGLRRSWGYVLLWHGDNSYVVHWDLPIKNQEFSMAMLVDQKLVNLEREKRNIHHVQSFPIGFIAVFHPFPNLFDQHETSPSHFSQIHDITPISSNIPQKIPSCKHFDMEKSWKTIKS